MYKVNYDTAREEAGLSWSIGSSVYSYIELAGISLSEFNRNPLAGIEAYKPKYANMVREMVGDIFTPAGIATPAVSYGHINFLGVPLVFPEGEGEVNYEHQHKSLDDWIKILKDNMEFREMTPEGQFFLDYRDKLQEAYPDKKVNWSMGYEGPMTTAYELRDMDVFYDLFDDPEKLREYLHILTLNIVEYIKFHRRVNNIPEFNPYEGFMCDDIASLIPANMFAEFVIPYWDIYYRGITSGKRGIHTEDHTYKTLKHFEDVNINYFDPSISHKLNPILIRDNCRVPFGWRMGAFHFTDLTPGEVKDWVYKAVEDGACKVFTHISKLMHDEPTITKIKAFHEAAVNAKDMFDSGATRKEIGKLVSPAGRKKFWDHWPE
ncbi:MAG: uroporphyrinogen decarboxylase family protein [Clostridia bacterium]|nr:uroporphyrinogen decarboxylase family protein [Clostridia bacterium]